MCLCGGIAGIALAFGLGAILANVDGGFQMIYSTASIVWAFVCSTLIGIVLAFTR